MKKYTAAHWGSYQIEGGTAPLSPLHDDPQPSRIGKGWVSASRDKNSRIKNPSVRHGWLCGDKGKNRNNDKFVEVSWDRAIELAANELDRVRSTYGNGAIFGGSYDWSSAGRFHHAQSQMRRFLNLAGGLSAQEKPILMRQRRFFSPILSGFPTGPFKMI